MKLYGLLLYKKFKLIYTLYNLSDFNFLIRSTISSEIENFSKDMIREINHNQFYKINEKIHNTPLNILYYSNKYQCILLTDLTYPDKCGFHLIKKIVNTVPPQLEIDNLWKKYQHPKNFDKIEESKIIIFDSLEKIIEKTSKEMKQRNRDLNTCCTIL